MGNFLSQNAPLLIAILGLCLTIIIQWDVIIKRFTGTFDSVPFIVFKVLMVSFSGIFVSSIFWIMLDYLVLGRLSLNVVLLDIATGAAWGIPLAILGGFLSRSADGAAISGIPISIILLLLFGPKNIIAPPLANLLQRQTYFIVLLLWALSIGAVCGYAGFKARSFVENASRATSKS